MKTHLLYPCTWIAVFFLLIACSTEPVLDASASLSNKQEANFDAAKKIPDPCTFSDGLVTSFNPFLGQFPEGIIMDEVGNLYAGIAPLGLIVKVNCDGNFSPIANIGSLPLDPNELFLGLETDYKGMIYAALSAPGKPYNGIWRVDPLGNEAPTHLTGSDQIFFPNDLTFDSKGNLYVTSTSGPPTGPGTFAQGSIWKIPKDGSAQLWLADESLTGSIIPEIDQPLPLGANGIAYRNNELVIGVTSKYHIVKVSINPDGSAGDPEILVNLFDPSDPTAGIPDGVALDTQGNIYAPTPGDSKLLRISPDGSQVEVLADFTHQLSNPAGITFGKTSNNQKAVFITNFSPPDLPKPPVNVGPSIVKIDVGIPGSPKS